MLLGIDVGGTHTDAVVLDETGIKASAKVVTDHDNLLRPIRAAMEAVLSQVDPSRVTRLNLSTTLSTNSIIEGKTENVGVIVSAGPGIDPENHRIGGYYYIVDGAIDHRGTTIKELDRDQLETAVQACRDAGVRVFSAVAKFSTRNPAYEQAIKDCIGPDADFITMGHSLSGVLNFPRRIATAHFNSAVWRIYSDFAWAVEESVADYGLQAEVNVLKADGGTMPLELSKNLPVETILSGPAASVMGIIALCDIHEDCIILDIGGTTTDIAVFADGAPIIESDGMTVGSYPTLVRALKVRSIGVGGDSALHVSPQWVRVGPERFGPSLASCAMSGGLACKIGSADRGYSFGSIGPVCAPALTDAMNYLGITQFGDREASVQGLKQLAQPLGLDPQDVAQEAVRYAVEQIRFAVTDLVDEINEKPVYTIFELLKGKKISPRKVYVMGGPAQAFAGLLADALGLEVVVPDHYAVANAIGAALTRTTMDVELFADTEKGQLFVPNLNISRRIDRGYNIEQAKEDAKVALAEHLRDMGIADGAVPEVTEATSFNMVDGYRTTGRNIRVKCQIRPSVLRNMF